jgi:hypothetical protein
MKGDQSIVISQPIAVCPIHNLRAEVLSSHYYHVDAYAMLRGAFIPKTVG